MSSEAERVFPFAEQQIWVVGGRPRVEGAFVKRLARMTQLSHVRGGATFAAAGTVVTEMNTPDSPPVRAEVSDSTPAAAAITATMSVHRSGW